MSFERWIYNFLQPRGRHMVTTLVATMCADEQEMLQHVRLQRVVLRVERFISELPLFYFLSVKVALFLMEYALPPLSWKVIPFSKMSSERRQRYLAEWQGSSFYPKRVIFRLATAICLGHLYSERKLLASLGFEDAMASRIAHHVHR